MGADRDVLSSGGTRGAGAEFPTIKTKLPNWSEDNLVNPATGQVCEPSEGRDDSGNVALISPNGQLQIEDTDTHAEFGVFAENNDPVQSSNNANFFFPDDATGDDSGDLHDGSCSNAKGLSKLGGATCCRC